MKNALYFTSKAFLVLKIFKFCLDFLVMNQNGLIKKIQILWRHSLVNKQL